MDNTNSVSTCYWICEESCTCIYIEINFEISIFIFEISIYMYLNDAHKLLVCDSLSITNTVGLVGSRLLQVKIEMVKWLSFKLF